MTALRPTAVLCAAFALGCGGLAGCLSGPPRAPALEPDTVRNRQLQTRRVAAATESEVLSACATALQDMGFMLEESEAKLGIITASKGFAAPVRASTLTAKQQALGETVLGGVVAVALVAYVATNPGVLVMALLSGPSSHTPPPQPEQIRVTLVINATAESDSASFLVRATFQTWLSRQSTGGVRIISAEPLNKPALYDEFFKRLTLSLSRESPTT